MKLRQISFVLLISSCYSLGIVPFHGCLEKVVLSNLNYSGRIIEENQITKLVQPVHDQYFILIHDDNRNSLFDNNNWYERLRKVLLSKYPYSAVFETYWQWSRIIFYQPGYTNVKETALDYLYLYNLLADNGVSPKKIIVIGHGMGALLGSEAAASFESVHGIRIGRLIVMDPAEITSIFKASRLFITKNKADFVMAIHTVTGPQTVPEGSIDFFPNGGKYQPGCSSWFFNFCGNKRSFEYLIAAVSYQDHFKGYKCDSYAKFKQGKCRNEPVSMGDLETMETGAHYLETTAYAPYFKD